MQPMQPDPTASAFAVRGLTKVYGDKAVVDHLNLDVPRGSIYGIVGPNGAGKTTMLGMATGLSSSHRRRCIHLGPQHVD